MSEFAQLVANGVVTGRFPLAHVEELHRPSGHDHSTYRGDQ